MNVTELNDSKENLIMNECSTGLDQSRDHYGPMRGPGHVITIDQ